MADRWEIAAFPAEQDVGINAMGLGEFSDTFARAAALGLTGACPKHPTTSSSHSRSLTAANCPSPSRSCREMIFDRPSKSILQRSFPVREELRK